MGRLWATSTNRGSTECCEGERAGQPCHSSTATPLKKLRFSRPSAVLLVAVSLNAAHWRVVLVPAMRMVTVIVMQCRLTLVASRCKHPRYTLSTGMPFSCICFNKTRHRVLSTQHTLLYELHVFQAHARALRTTAAHTYTKLALNDALRHNTLSAGQKWQLRADSRL